MAIKIRNYVKAHNNGQGGNGGTTLIERNVGNADLPADIVCKSITAANGHIDYLDSKSISANDIGAEVIGAQQGQIANISGFDLDYENGHIKNLTADNLSLSKLSVDELNALTAYIKTLQSDNITTEYLTVTKQAHFFELMIDKVRSAGGQIILSPANCQCSFARIEGDGDFKDNWFIPFYYDEKLKWDKYDAYNPIRPNYDYYTGRDIRLFYNAKDNYGNQITSDWVENDQALCQAFNLEGAGTTKYYWHKVKEVSKEPVLVNFDTGWYGHKDTQFANPNWSKGPVFTVFLTMKMDYNALFDIYNNLSTWSRHNVNHIFSSMLDLHLEIIDEDGNKVENTDDIIWTINDYKNYNINGTFAYDWSFILTLGENINKYKVHAYFTKKDNMPDDIKNNDIKQFIIDNEIDKMSLEEILSYVDELNFMPTNVANDKHISLCKIYNVVINDNSTLYNSIADYNHINWNEQIFFADGSSEAVSNTYIDYNDTYIKNVIKCQEHNNNLTDIYLTFNMSNPWHECYYIVLDGQDHDTNQAPFTLDTLPAPGDEIVQLGNRTEKDRQSAIVISAYKSPDSDIEAPSYAQYIGINDYDLKRHRQSYFDRNGAKFVGDITLATVDGSTLNDYLEQQNKKAVKYSAKLVPSTSYINRKTKDGVYVVEPDKITGIVAYTDENGQYKTSNIVPEGYSLYARLYTDNMQEILNTRHEFFAGDRIEAETPNAFIVNNENVYVQKIRLTLCDDVPGSNYMTAPIIDMVDITYELDAAEGRPGRDGKDGQLTYLLPQAETIYAGLIDKMTGANDTEGFVNLFCNLEYTVGRVTGDNATILEDWYREYDIRIRAYSQSSNESEIFSYIWTNDSASQSSGILKHVNLLELINSRNVNSRYPMDYTDVAAKTLWDYINCYDKQRDRCPIYFTVELLGKEDNAVVDKRVVYVVLQSGAALSIRQDAIIAAVAQASVYADNRVDGLQTWVTNNYSTTTQTADMIETTVKSQMSGYATLNDLESSVTQTASSILSTVQENYYNKDYIDGILDNTNSILTELDLLDGFDDDTFYPVVIRPSQAMLATPENKVAYTMQVDREVDNLEYGTPSWGDNSRGYRRGSSLFVNWTVMLSQWGGFSQQPYVNNYYLKWTARTPGEDWTTKVLCSIEQYNPNSEIIFYLRGGSKYNFRVDHTGFTVIVNKKAYSAQTTDPNTLPTLYPLFIGEDHDELRIPTVDRMHRSEIEQTARSISLSVIEQTGVSEEDLKRTGIDITSGQITLEADKTSIHGGQLGLYTGAGLIFYDADGVPRINIKAQDLDTTNYNEGSTEQNFNWTGGNETLIIGQRYGQGGTNTVTIQTETFTLGRIKAGSSINVYDGWMRPLVGDRNWLLYDSSVEGRQNAAAYAMIEFIYNGNVVKSELAYVNQLHMFNQISWYTRTDVVSHTVTSEQTAGTWELRFSFNWNNNLVDFYNGVANNVSYTYKARVNVKYADIPVKGMLELASNGINFNASDNEFIVLRENLFEANAGAAGIRFKPDTNNNMLPTQRFVTRSSQIMPMNKSTDYYGGLGSQLRLKNEATTTIGTDADIFVFDTGHVPSEPVTISNEGAFIGRIIYIVLNDVDITLKPDTYSVLVIDGQSTSDNKTLRAGVHTCICTGDVNTSYIRWAIS